MRTASPRTHSLGKSKSSPLPPEGFNDPASSPARNMTITGAVNCECFAVFLTQIVELMRRLSLRRLCDSAKMRSRNL